MMVLVVCPYKLAFC